MPFSLVPVFFLVLPLLEIAGFIVVGRQIGVLATIGLIILSTVLGFVLVRIRGLGVLSRIRQISTEGGVPDRELVHGAMILVAGFLLVVPGFITSTIGLLLFIPPVRDIAWHYMRRHIIILSESSTFSARTWRYSREDKVIDLDEDEYSSSRSAGDTPWRRIDKD